MLQNPPPADWLQWGRTYDGQNFSPLEADQPEQRAEPHAGMASAVARAARSMPTPLVHDGVMFLQTIPDTVLALDGSNGTILWRHQYKPTVAVEQEDGPRAARQQSVGADLRPARAGAGREDRRADVGSRDRPGQPADGTHPIPVAQRAARRRRQGDPGRDRELLARGGFIVALDINTGKELWRFNTIARPGEPGGNTWNGLPLEQAERRLGLASGHLRSRAGPHLLRRGADLRHRTASASGDDAGVTSDALYTNCTIAMHPDTGKLVWHYQHMANDQWDLDWVFERQIVTMTVDGRPRKVVMNVGKMAILEALDAATGEYLFSVDAGMQNVITTSIRRPAPRPSIRTDARPDRPTVICPGVSGRAGPGRRPPTARRRRCSTCR